MNTAEITLSDMLAARDRRAARQRALLAQYRRPLVSFTMNIAGPVKTSPLVRFAFSDGLAALEAAAGRPVHAEKSLAPTGCEALLVYALPAPELKRRCLAIEEGSPVGRLYDMDVLGPDGEKLSRPDARRCLVCGGPAAVCAASRAHGLEAVAEKTRGLLEDFACSRLAALAEQALLSEAAFTPKPGLVDSANSGAHDDMDLPLFQKSARALRPHLERFVRLGLDGASAVALQKAGVEAEAAMFSATGGVNTHKGAVYILSLLLFGMGRSLQTGEDPFAAAARTAAALPAPTGTHGGAVREKYRCGGVREQALAGFPAARQTRAVLEARGELDALLWCMAQLEDSTLLYRGGPEALALVRREAAAVLAAPEGAHRALAEDLDARLIARHLSPGGSADLLAAALFLQSLSPLLPLP